MRKKKTVTLAVVMLILAVLGAMVGFYFTRPEIAFVTDPLPDEFISRLSKPSKLTSSYRLSLEDSMSFSDRADYMIDVTKDGIYSDKPVHRPLYSVEELFSPILSSLAGEEIALIFDETDESQYEFSLIVKEMFPDAVLIPYEYEMSKSDYSIYRGKLEPGMVLMIPDLYSSIDFVRTLESPRLAVDWLDAAALETICPEFVASPDWEDVISSLFSENV